MWRSEHCNQTQSWFCWMHNSGFSNLKFLIPPFITHLSNFHSFTQLYLIQFNFNSIFCWQSKVPIEDKKWGQKSEDGIVTMQIVIDRNEMTYASKSAPHFTQVCFLFCYLCQKQGIHRNMNDHMYNQLTCFNGCESQWNNEQEGDMWLDALITYLTASLDKVNDRRVPEAFRWTSSYCLLQTSA